MFIAHGFIAGLVTEIGGGRFSSGFLAGGIGSLAPAPAGDQPWEATVDGAVESAALGGAGSVLGGGKFENGAVTGAFGYLFNAVAHRQTLSARDKAYLDRYYDAVVAAATADDVNPAYVLGVGIESGFASQGTYSRTGDAFGMTGGSTATMEYFDSPQQNVSAWFHQWGSQVVGDLNDMGAFINSLEGQDASGTPIAGWKVYNSYDPTGWKTMIQSGILQIQRDVPLYLQQRSSH